MTLEPIDIDKWLSENEHLLKPPVNNYCLQYGGFTVMIIGGPNKRKEYHINQTAEWFFQYKGKMLLNVIEDGKQRDIYIKEKCCFLLPPNIPHRPIRYADTVGIVVEQDRPEQMKDTMRWYCDHCGKILHEKSFHCVDLGTQVHDAIMDFTNDHAARTCKCGHFLDL